MSKVHFMAAVVVLSAVAWAVAPSTQAHATFGGERAHCLPPILQRCAHLRSDLHYRSGRDRATADHTSTERRPPRQAGLVPERQVDSIPTCWERVHIVGVSERPVVQSAGQWEQPHPHRQRARVPAELLSGRLRASLVPERQVDRLHEGHRWWRHRRTVRDADERHAHQTGHGEDQAHEIRRLRAAVVPGRHPAGLPEAQQGHRSLRRVHRAHRRHPRPPLDAWNLGAGGNPTSLVAGRPVQFTSSNRTSRTACRGMCASCTRTGRTGTASRKQPRRRLSSVRDLAGRNDDHDSHGARRRCGR